MADLAKLVVTLEAQTAQYMQQLDLANKKLDKFAKNTTSAGKSISQVLNVAVIKEIGTALFEMSAAVVENAAHLEGLSKSTGVNAEALSQLSYAAKQSETDLGGLEIGLKKMTKAAAQAASGSKQQAEVFEKIGVSVTDASGALKPMDQLLLDVAESFSHYEDGAGKAAAAQMIFGKSGMDLIPFLDKGRAGIEALEKEADRLGITISGNTAKAAQELEDSVKSLKAQFDGFIINAIAPLLPDLNMLIKSFSDSSSGAKEFSDSAEILQTGLRLIASVGLTVVDTFKNVGKDLGALAAAAVAAASGDFGRVVDIFKERNADALESDKKFMDRMDIIWGEGLEEIVVTAEKSDKKLKKTLLFNPDAKDNLKSLEIFISASKIYVSAMDKLYDDLNEDTKSSTEKQVAQLDKISVELDELAKAGKISAETYQERWSDAVDSVIPKIEVTAKKLGPEFLKQFDKVNEFQLQLARNTQDIIANTLENGFKGGIKGILDSFEKMLTQLAAQAVAADIGKYLFGSITAGGQSPGGNGNLGGLFGKGLDFLSGLFGGSKDDGGRGKPGTAYMIGTGAQPEMFVPDSPGTFYPNGMHPSGAGVTQNIYVAGRVDERTARQISAEATRRQRAAARFA